MNFRSVISKFAAYSILGVLAFMFMVTFVTVPFHESDVDENKTYVENVTLEEAYYPAIRVFNISVVQITDAGNEPLKDENAFETISLAGPEGIDDAGKLLSVHRDEVHDQDIGRINYTYNSDQTMIHWDKEQGALVESEYRSEYVKDNETIVSKSNRTISDEAKLVQDIHFDVPDARYDSGEYYRIEQDMYEVIKNTNYEAIDAWVVHGESSTGYVKYVSVGNDSYSELVIDEDGVIREFEYEGENVEISFSVELENEAPPLFQPSWVDEN